MDECLDYKLQHNLQARIASLPYEQRKQLKGLELCSRNPIHQKGGDVAGVYLLRNNVGGATYFGNAHCKNPTCCPICSARIMEGYRARIASALEMMREKGYFGFMITFTIPHLDYMSCREVTDILYNTWTYFRMKNFKKNFHVYQQFMEELGIKHFVRICEYTYSDKNGWHPHFHAIFWCPRDKADKVLDWRYKLNHFWQKIAKDKTLKYWKENGLHTGLSQSQEELCESLHSTVSDAYPSVKISTTKDGKLSESLSSEYLTGWGGDRELTGNYRKEASHEGHYTPYQILQMAESQPRWMSLYIDFCLAVTRKPVHHRVTFSKDGFKQELDAYIKEHGKVLTLYQKKKVWEVVEFFSESEWAELCYLNMYAPVLSNILYLATQSMALLEEYLQFLEIRRGAVHLSDYQRVIDQQMQHIQDIFNGVA